MNSSNVRRSSKHAGDGWVLVGDAWGFIDPIYSSGVYFALKSGEHAADAIINALRIGDTSGKQLSRWVDNFHSGTKWIRKLVDAYYTNEFSFGRFMKAHPEHKGNLTDLLIGRIFYDGAGKIFDDMDPALEDAKREAAASSMLG
jgi:flavin-dependent dehydrogenase